MPAKRKSNDCPDCGQVEVLRAGGKYEPGGKHTCPAMLSCSGCHQRKADVKLRALGEEGEADLCARCYAVVLDRIVADIVSE